MFLKPKRHCAECRAVMRVEKRDMNKPYLYCSSGCKANGWRRVHRLEPVREWYGRNITASAAQMLAGAT